MMLFFGKGRELKRKSPQKKTIFFKTLINKAIKLTPLCSIIFVIFWFRYRDVDFGIVQLSLTVRFLRSIALLNYWYDSKYFNHMFIINWKRTTYTRPQCFKKYFFSLLNPQCRDWMSKQFKQRLKDLITFFVKTMLTRQKIEKFEIYKIYSL